MTMVLNEVQVEPRDPSSGVASQKIFGANPLTLSEQQYFVCDTASQKHKMTRYTRHLGGHDLLATPATLMGPPGFSSDPQRVPQIFDKTFTDLSAI